jgi:hypothetical protein
VSFACSKSNYLSVPFFNYILFTINHSRFTQEDIGSNNILKSSAQRAMKKKITELYPLVTEDMIEEIFPKKLNIIATKW